MSLVAGRGPLSADPAGWFAPPLPADAVFVEPHPRRIQAVSQGRTVLDTEAALLVHRRGHPLSYAFPEALVVDLPHAPVEEAPGYAHVPWDAVDTWIEEGRELVHVADTVLVDTVETVTVFETALAPVLYVDPAQVRMDLLRPSATTSYCNYKGWATYWTATVAGTVVEDVAWSYPDPPPECSPIASHLSFDATRAQVLAELPAAGDGADCGCA
jgi:uncharacterized protein (DUF427 family)